MTAAEAVDLWSIIKWLMLAFVGIVNVDIGVLFLSRRRLEMIEYFNDQISADLVV